MTTSRYIYNFAQAKWSYLVILVLSVLILPGQDPHDLLNQWHTNAVGDESFGQCQQWKITFPDGSKGKDLCHPVDRVKQEYYYVNETDDGIVFRVPIRSNNGTTPNSKNVRSELRELTQMDLSVCFGRHKAIT